MNRIIKWTQRRNNGEIIGFLFLITIASTVGSFVAHPQFDSRTWVSDWLQNFSTEMMGAILTFLLFDLIVNIRNEKKSLIVDLKSGDVQAYNKALEQMKANNWLVDGSLENADIANAKLQGQDLKYINLKGAYLRNVNFEGADLQYAELENAVLINANLRNADLSSCDLENANLQNADLRGAILGAAILKRANLKHAKFDDTTKWFRLVGKDNLPAILPDGSKYSENVDLSTFTLIPMDESKEA